MLPKIEPTSDDSPTETSSPPSSSSFGKSTTEQPSGVRSCGSSSSCEPVIESREIQLRRHGIDPDHMLRVAEKWRKSWE